MQIYNENNLDTMRSMEDNSVDAIVCDPPYGISFMNSKWDYNIPSVETWKECLRVLKPGGHLLAFSGTRTYHRMASNIEDAGFEIRDMISWMYGCYSEDTEVLTKRGWINYKDFKDDYVLQWDKEEFSWFKPDTFFEYEIDDNMVLLGEQLVTKNHKVFYKDKYVTWNYAGDITEVNIPYYYPDKIVYQKEKAVLQPYKGKVWCLTTETGAFVVRRNGKAFISGNSGFPKSLNISKALDKKAFTDWLKDNPDMEKEYLEEIKDKKDYSEITIKYKKIAGLYKVVGKQYHPTSTDRTGNKSPFQGETHLDGNFEITAPMSEKAKEYEGFGTSLKPAHECVVCATKKSYLNDIVFYINNITLEIKRSLCQSPLFVEIVKNHLRFDLPELKEENIVPWYVGNNINLLEDLYVLMDMLQLKSMENLNLNIVLSWVNTMIEIYKKRNKFTTLMKINLIIDLKILSSLTWESIYQNTILVKNKKIDGYKAPVSLVETHFKDLKLKLKTIHIPFVPENVILKEKRTNLPPNKYTKSESISLARKPLSEKTIAENILKWGTGGINIDGCRIDHDEKKNTTNRVHEYKEPSWGKGKSQSKNHISSASPKGRFPANIILDGSEEVEKIFPESKGQQGDIKGTEPSSITKDIYGKYNSRQPSIKRNDEGSASRFFYCAKSSRSDRTNDGVVDNTHPTCKPTELMQYLVRLYTPINGTVYDPFMGSGTTGKAALLEGFNFIGSEMEEKYFNIAKARLENTIQFIKDPQSLVIEKKVKHLEKTLGMKSIFGRKK